MAAAPAPAAMEEASVSLAAVITSDLFLGLGLGPTAALALRPASREVGQAAAAALTALLARCPGALCVCGGTDGERELRSAEQFDPVKGVWEPMPAMLQARSEATAAALRGMLYVCGGHDGEEHLNSAERFNPAQGCWEALPEMQRRRAGAAAAALGGTLIVCGGTDGHRDLAAAECWDPDACAWRALPAMVQPRHAAAAACVRGRLYVCGGSARPGPLRSVEAFGFSPDAWRPVMPMAEGRRWAAAAAAAGRLHVCGGESRPEPRSRGRHGVSHGGLPLLASAERFDPILGEWEALPDMPTGVAHMASATIAGRILICGGSKGTAGSLAPFAANCSAQHLDPAAGPWSRWEALPRPLEPRLLAAGAALLA